MADIQDGQTATNPNTGQKIVFRAGQWHSAPGAPSGPQPKAMSPKDIAAANAKQQTLNALATQYSRVKKLYEKNLKGVGPGSLLEYLPLPRNKAFNSAAAGLSDLAMAAFRVPGIGAQSDADAARLAAANQPSASDSDEAIEAKLANLRNRLDQSGVVIPGEPKPGRAFKVIR